MVTLSSFIFVNGTVTQYNFIDTCRLAFNELNTANELFSRARKFNDWNSILGATGGSMRMKAGL